MGLPAAFFHFHLHNPTHRPVRAVLFASLENRVGHPDVGEGLNEYFEAGGVRGLKFSSTRHAPGSPRFGTLALATSHADLNVQTHLFRGRWFDSLQRYTDEVQAGALTENRAPASGWHRPEAGALGLRVNLAPGERVRLPVWIIWHNPNFEMYWSEQEPRPVWANHYATRFADAVAVAQYVAQHAARLDEETRRFTHALFSSTLPAAVLDAVSSQISILKTNTCVRLTDGTFYGWEGCYGQAGSCEGRCTHVWNYAQALPFLFPSLERSMRAADYAYNQQPNGHMTFRLPLPLGTLAARPFLRLPMVSWAGCSSSTATGSSPAMTTGCAGCGPAPAARSSTPGRVGQRSGRRDRGRAAQHLRHRVLRSQHDDGQFLPRRAARRRRDGPPPGRGRAAARYQALFEKRPRPHRRDPVQRRVLHAGRGAAG